jgi:hypothetical protein
VHRFGTATRLNKCGEEITDEGFFSSARLHELPALFPPNPQLVKYAGFPLNQGLNTLALLSSRHTIQMMAKAAVAVYEAAVENQRREK